MSKVSYQRRTGKRRLATGALATLVAMGLGSGIVWGGDNGNNNNVTSSSTINVTATIPTLASVTLGSAQQNVDLSPTAISDSAPSKDVNLSIFCNSHNGCTVTVQTQDATGSGNETTADFQLTPSGKSQASDGGTYLTTIVYDAVYQKNLTFDGTGTATITPKSGIPGTAKDTLTISLPFNSASQNASQPAGSYAGNLIVTVTAGS